MIGTIDLRVDPLKEVAELGYTLNKAFWGQGIVPEAARMLLSLGFEKLALVRIYDALHDQRNHRSVCRDGKNWHEKWKQDSGCAKISWASSGRSDAGNYPIRVAKTNHVKVGIAMEITIDMDAAASSKNLRSQTGGRSNYLDLKMVWGPFPATGDLLPVRY